MTAYRVLVTQDDTITEYEGELFANNERWVMLDTSTGRVVIEKDDETEIEFEVLT
jgi:hypothetical protein